jgi:hypothetical protein
MSKANRLVEAGGEEVKPKPQPERSEVPDALDLLLAPT